MNDNKLYVSDLAIKNNKSLMLLSPSSQYSPWSLAIQFKTEPNRNSYPKKNVSTQELADLFKRRDWGIEPREFTIYLSGEITDIESQSKTWFELINQPETQGFVTIDSINCQSFSQIGPFDDFMLETDNSVYTSLRVDKQQFIDRKKELKHFEFNGECVTKDGNEYKAIKFIDGNLEQVMNRLKEIQDASGKVCYDFNGHILFSDMTIEEACFELLDMDEEQIRFKQIEDEAKSHATQEEIDRYEKLCSIVSCSETPDFVQSFYGIAQESLRQGYGCREIDCMLTLVYELDEENAPLDYVDKLLRESDLSEAEKNFVAWEVQELSSRGDAFYEFAINGINIEQTGHNIGNN